MVSRLRQTAHDASKAEVGEIDTSAPFQSVKAALSLFGASAKTPERHIVRRTRPVDLETRVEKERQLLLAQKELNKYKEQLQSAETTKVQALSELETAKKTVEELTKKLSTLHELKETAVKAAKDSINQAKQVEAAKSNQSIATNPQWENELAQARERYSAAMAELSEAKQELSKMRQSFSSTVEVKTSAEDQVTKATKATEANKQRKRELTKEIASTHDSALHMKQAYTRSLQEETEVVHKPEHEALLDQKQKEIDALQKQIASSGGDADLEARLTSAMAEVGSLQKELQTMKASKLDSVAVVTVDLGAAKENLHKVVEEEQALKNMLESLKQELENVRREHQEMKEKDTEAETLACDLNIKLENAKSELEVAVVAETKANAATDDLESTLRQLSSESEAAKSEADKYRQEAEELRKEAEATRVILEETGKKLKEALRDADEAKVSEAIALDQIKILSEKTNAARSSTSESSAIITISMDEYESLNRKVNDADNLAGMKVSAAVAQVEAVRASENEALRKLEAIKKEIEEIGVATEEALRSAEMAESAKQAVEGEMKRWRENEMRQSLSEAPPELPSIPVKENVAKRSEDPKMKKTLRQNSASKIVSSPATGKKKTWRSLREMFQKKKLNNGGDAVGVQSYLPGEPII